MKVSGDLVNRKLTLSQNYSKVTTVGLWVLFSYFLSSEAYN